MLSLSLFWNTAFSSAHSVWRERKEKGREKEEGRQEEGKYKFWVIQFLFGYTLLSSLPSFPPLFPPSLPSSLPSSSLPSSSLPLFSSVLTSPPPSFPSSSIFPFQPLLCYPPSPFLPHSLPQFLWDWGYTWRALMFLIMLSSIWRVRQHCTNSRFSIFCRAKDSSRFVLCTGENLDTLDRPVLVLKSYIYM